MFRIFFFSFFIADCLKGCMGYEFKNLESLIILAFFSKLQSGLVFQKNKNYLQRIILGNRFLSFSPRLANRFLECMNIIPSYLLSSNQMKENTGRLKRAKKQTNKQTDGRTDKKWDRVSVFSCFLSGVRQDLFKLERRKSGIMVLSLMKDKQ